MRALWTKVVASRWLPFARASSLVGLGMLVGAGVAGLAEFSSSWAVICLLLLLWVVCDRATAARHARLRQHFQHMMLENAILKRAHVLRDRGELDRGPVDAYEPGEQR